jgi:hypothetical protein
VRIGHVGVHDIRPRLVHQRTQTGQIAQRRAQAEMLREFEPVVVDQPLARRASLDAVLRRGPPVAAAGEHHRVAQPLLRQRQIHRRLRPLRPAEVAEQMKNAHRRASSSKAGFARNPVCAYVGLRVGAWGDAPHTHAPTHSHTHIRTYAC